MITLDQAYERIRGLSTKEIRELTVRRLRGEDAMPVGSGYTDEPSEDLVIQLLRNPKLQKSKQKAVLAGCKDVYAELLRWLASADGDIKDSLLPEALLRVCRVVDVAAPKDLSLLADTMLTIVRGKPGIPADVLAAAVRACMGFDQTPGSIPLWEELLEIPEVAAYALNVLVTVDPDRERTKARLVELYRKQIEDGWPVDTAFLIRRAARIQGDPKMIEEVLTALQLEKCWPQVQSSLALRKWSKIWLPSRDELSHRASQVLMRARLSQLAPFRGFVPPVEEVCAPPKALQASVAA